MGLFASIDSFFKDYASIIDNETNYTSGNIDVSKTTYLRRDSFFVENAVYYNQLRYELINKAFEVDETTFSKGITQIPVKDISIIKQEILINLKDLFLNSRDEVQHRYFDVLKFRVNIIETLISAITFATYAGDINKAISNLINTIDRVCKLSNSFDDELIELQNLLNSVLDAYEFLTSDRN
jgi:methyl-accepting chemotaxis protein